MESASAGVSVRLTRALPQRRSALAIWATSSGPSWSPSPLALRTTPAGEGRPPCPSPRTLTCLSSPCPSHPTS
eukprot:5029210-Pleurochrysis_carterae.AAC.1